jgi:hypothetical protein
LASEVRVHFALAHAGLGIAYGVYRGIGRKAEAVRAAELRWRFSFQLCYPSIRASCNELAPS